MVVIEINAWVEADGWAWEGVGYFPVPLTLKEAYKQADKISDGIRFQLEEFERVDLSTLELYRSPYQTMDPAAIRRICKWIGDNPDKGKFDLCWTKVATPVHTKEVTRGQWG